MTKEKQEELINKYGGKVLPSYWTDRTKSNMAWGFAVGDGWFDLVERVCKKVAEVEGVYLAQVKEKFGGLRIYTEPHNDEVQEVIDQAENESFQTCEECGESGRPRSGLWVKTLCDEHAKPSQP